MTIYSIPQALPDIYLLDEEKTKKSLSLSTRKKREKIALFKKIEKLMIHFDKDGLFENEIIYKKLGEVLNEIAEMKVN